ncbi:MAG TPA: mechanosensitive ion channel [Acetivibrio sp.]|nr:mechanosensitive ion channel [Clostridium sp.]HQA58839.1 mechanosensitive ion channel [Acetivibrio sp.]
MRYFFNMIESFLSGVPSVIHAVLLLVLAYVVALIAKSLVVKGLKLLNVDKRIDKLGIVDEITGSSLDFIGKLVFVIVFLMFLPAVLEKLGIDNVSTPITMLVTQFLNYIPNIIAAIIILMIGSLVAKIVRQLITPILKKLNVDKLQEKAGISTSENATISSVISYIIYVIILIPVIIAALQALNITAISNPAMAMLNSMFQMLPNIFVAIALVVIGTIVAKIIGKLLAQILSGFGTDSLWKKIVPSDNSKLKDFSLSKAIGEFVKYIIILLFVVEATNVINLEVFRNVGGAIIAYLPMVISSVIILGIALLISSWVGGFIQNKYPDAKLTSMIAKTAIIVVAVFMVLIQLGIATTIVNAAFIIVLGAIALAFAIAFGIGGRDFAANTLKKFENPKKN